MCTKKAGIKTCKKSTLLQKDDGIEKQEDCPASIAYTPKITIMNVQFNWYTVVSCLSLTPSSVVG